MKRRSAFDQTETRTRALGQPFPPADRPNACINRNLDNRIRVTLDKAMALRRDPKAVRNTRKSLLLEMVLTLSDLLAEKCNQPLTSCGTEHLAAERALAIIERHGLPNSSEAWEHLTYLTDKAGQGFNARSIGHADPGGDDDDLPF